MNKAFTQRYKTHRGEKGFGFTFYCDYCEKFVRTDIIETYSFDKALEQAQVMAKLYFNKCHKCGKWVCDKHYNENEMMCVQCKPKSGKAKIARKIKAILQFICKRWSLRFKKRTATFTSKF